MVIVMDIVEETTARQASGFDFRVVRWRNEKMICRRLRQPLRSNRGFSLIELLIVVAISGTLTAIAVPQMIAQRRLNRSTELAREITSQLRYTRQLAMSERQAFTFQYDDTTKQIRIIDHNNDTSVANSSTAVLADPSYPNTTLPAKVVSTISLTQGGLTSGEISYGTPTAGGLPAGASVPTQGPLGDGISMSALTTNILNITFQPDGSVIDPAGIPAGGILLSAAVPLDRAMFMFNNQAPQTTLWAISVIGASGRVKVWRYIPNGNTYAE